MEFHRLVEHIGHSVVCVGYHDGDYLVEASVECEDCNEVLYTVGEPSSEEEK